MPSVKSLMRKRVAVLLLVGVLVLGLLMLRLAYIQLYLGDDLRQAALDNRMRDFMVEAKRGTIYDRHGNELAVSISADSAFIVPEKIRDPEKTAQVLAEVLHRDPQEIYTLLTSTKSFIWLERQLDFKVAQEIKKLQLSGIEFVEESKRQYLKEEQGAHLLGFAGVDNQGLTGLEAAYDQELGGVPGHIILEYDAVGRQIPTAVHKQLPSVPGHDLYLTIDETIQYYVERELDLIVEKHEPKYAVIIVMDPQTGEILALGNRPTFNPNQWAGYPRELWDRNPAIWYNYEPGSTFKIMTLSAALQEKNIDLNRQYYCPGHITVSDRRIRCWEHRGHESQSFAEVVHNSCNPGFIEIGLELGTENVYRYIRNFGFDQKTGISLPGESTGILVPESQVTRLDLATMSIGQSVAVTPIQLITAVAAVANGGDLLKPQLVNRMDDYEGNLVYQNEAHNVRQILSPEVALQAQKLLENVVAEGTGVNAAVDGYRLAGKTGTAEVVSSAGGYKPGHYVASFVGFGPVEKPEIAALVLVAEPQGGEFYGSQVAAPVFSRLMQDVFRYMGLPPQQSQPNG